jgi:hypothetical protein
MRQKAEILSISGAAPININLLVRNHIFYIQIAIAPLSRLIKSIHENWQKR